MSFVRFHRRSSRTTDPESSRAVARLGGLLYALFALAGIAQSVVIPLLPRLDRAYGLSPSQAALLVALPSLGTLAVSIPAGVLADRFGPRRMTIAAGALLFVSMAVEVLPSLTCLLVGRLGSGLSFGVVWTTGVAWLAQTQSEAGSPRIGALVTSSAVGFVTGPVLGGVFAQLVGLAAPFVLIAAVVGAVFALLCIAPAPNTRQTAQPLGLRRIVHAISQQPGALAGAASLGVAGAVSGAVQLLIPSALHRNGISSGGIGLAFSLTAGLYIIVSALVLRQGRRLITRRVTMTGALALALSPLPAVTSTQSAALISALMLCTIPRALVSTVAYPLATGDGARAGVRDGAVLGVMNSIWAGGMVVAPLLAGAVDQAAGPRSAYLVAMVPCVLVSVWLLARDRRQRVVPTTA